MLRLIAVPAGCALVVLSVLSCSVGQLTAQEPATAAAAQASSPQASAGGSATSGEAAAGQGSIAIPTAKVEEAPDPATLAAKASYIIGFNTAKKMVTDLSRQGVEVNQDRLLVGIQDALGDKQIAYSPEEVRTILTAYQKMLQKEKQEKIQKESAENRAKGDAYRKENGAKENVKQTESGIQYEVLTAGEGENLNVSETVLVDYTGKFIDGTEFDSSLKAKRGRPPTPLPMKVSGAGMIPAFKEVLPMMKVGSKWRVTIPPELAYQVRGSGPIGPNETLVFELDIKEKVEQPKKPAAAKPVTAPEAKE